jgi:uncharacterized protein YbjT (DUF2867 family)
MAAERLSAGSTVLVTGATGLIGSATADELLRRGFKVRAVTRDASKASALAAHFDKSYGAGQFGVVAIEDATRADAYDQVLKGSLATHCRARLSPLCRR